MMHTCSVSVNRLPSYDVLAERSYDGVHVVTGCDGGHMIGAGMWGSVI